jgi:hypothetical protein
MKSTALAASLLILTFVGPSALALTVEQVVTPDYVKEHPNAFKVSAERRDDGLIHFKIIYSLPGPRYLVSHFSLRRGGDLLAKSHTPLYAKERSATFYCDLSNECLDGSTFTLSEHSFTTVDG